MGRKMPQMVTVSPGDAIRVCSPRQVTVRLRGMLPTGTWRFQRALRGTALARPPLLDKVT